MDIKKKGFTLIELLVVIAIIAILLSILMPSLRKVKEVARNVICRSNLRQWGLVWNVYTNNYDTKFPSYRINGVKKWPRGIWVVALRDEWQSRGKMLLCPAAVKIKSPEEYDDEAAGNLDTAYRMGDSSELKVEDMEAEFCSYGMNVWALDASGEGSVQDRPEKDHWKRTGMGSSNEVPLFLDSVWRGGGPHYTDAQDNSPANENGEYINAGYEMSHFAMDRHSGGVNSLFMDFSVSQVPIKKLWKLRWHKTFDMRGYTTVTGKPWPTWMENYEDF